MYIVPDRVVAAPVPDGVAILNTQTNRYYTLNSVGEFIWRGLCAGQSQDDIVAGLAEEYDVEPGRAETDLTALVTNLVAAGLITETHEPA
ncbi:lasso peptide biosynthesis PqqD family chaperone [Hyphococcus sp.]|uniref:lasso peptide biosynthesis PqqD family chaperone n=1 Tax=Hyphococcus sp. TaxID=2038636 RepID=UPI0035C6B08A